MHRFYALCFAIVSLVSCLGCAAQEGKHTPLIIAHRGASTSAPENTMASFRKAVDWGFSFIELDL